MSKLNLGCGNDKREGYTNVDAIEAFHPDVVWDLYDPITFVQKGAVDEILAIDLLEHFDPLKAQELLCHWIGLLCPGGRIMLRVPDWTTIDKNSLEQVFGATMWKGVYCGAYGTHKWGYTRASLHDLMGHCGLKRIEVKRDFGQLYAQGWTDDGTIFLGTSS